MIRLGVTSRSAAIWSRVVHRARTAPRARRPRTLCRPDVRRHWSTRTVWVKVLSHSNSSPAQPSLPASTSSAPSTSRSSTRTSTSRAAYSSHGSGQRTGRPVHGRVLLGHPVAEQGLDQRGQADARVTEQAAGELGVEELRGVQADLVEAGQVLGRGVQDPLGALEDLLQRRHRVERDRVDQERARALAAQLDQVGARGVAVAGRALGVDRDRTRAPRHGRAHLGQPGLGLDDLAQAVAQPEQGCVSGRGTLVGFGSVGGRGLGGRHRYGLVNGRGRVALAGSGWRSRPRGPAPGPRPCRAARPRPRRAGRRPCPSGARRPGSGVHEARSSS